MELKTKTTYAALSLGLVLALSACGQNSSYKNYTTRDQSSFGILGGEEVKPTDALAHSVVAIIILMDDGEAVCTGTLVADQVVLTAAHCTEGAKRMVVVFSANPEAGITKENARVVSTVYVNPDYRPGTAANWNDLALLKISDSAPKNYKPVKLLDSSEALSANEDVVLAGYGATKMVDGKPEGSLLLRKATVQLTDPKYSTSEFLFDQTSDGKGACHGDSGGPAFAEIKGELVQIGVTSRAASNEGASTCMGGSIYTSVAAQQEFIAKAIVRLQANP